MGVDRSHIHFVLSDEIDRTNAAIRDIELHPTSSLCLLLYLFRTMSCLYMEEAVACVGMKATFQATQVSPSNRMGIPPHCTVFQTRRSDCHARGREDEGEKHQVNDAPTLIVFWSHRQDDQTNHLLLYDEQGMIHSPVILLLLRFLCLSSTRLEASLWAVLSQLVLHVLIRPVNDWMRNFWMGVGGHQRRCGSEGGEQPWQNELGCTFAAPLSLWQEHLQGSPKHSASARLQRAHMRSDVSATEPFLRWTTTGWSVSPCPPPELDNTARLSVAMSVCYLCTDWRETMNRYLKRFS